MFAGLFLLFLKGEGQQNYWQQHVDYRIDVKLIEGEKALEGFEKITYTNHSPDTLAFIWFHLWPNAYKNDKTAFSEQQLRNGSTRFYFSGDEDKGYINRIDFQSNGKPLEMLVHEQHPDIVRVKLNEPLPPGAKTVVTTPFYVRLPKYISRSGHIGKFFLATQWYPKPAVYDKEGWHPMPYLDQGEFYSEFGGFEVHITVPQNFLVAASGDLQNEDELRHLKMLGKTAPEQQPNYKYYVDTAKKAAKRAKVSVGEISRKPASDWKTLVYKLENAHDFAWFASKEFIVQYDTLQLGSKTVDAFSYYFPWMASEWKKSMEYVKDGTRFYSQQLGEYPYNTVAAVGTEASVASGGMEYPTITIITGGGTGEDLDEVITHEIGHNWFYGILGSNERRFPWMDEGMNTFYEKRYIADKYKKHNGERGNSFIESRMPQSMELMALKGLVAVHRDQPIASHSNEFTSESYFLIAYFKAALWMKHLEDYLGKDVFDSAMKHYYKQWKFKHPGPLDFKKSIEESSGKNIDALYDKLFSTGDLSQQQQKKKIKPALLFNMKEPDKYNYTSFIPALGYNMYDGVMAGVGIHNYGVPSQRLSYFIAPMYGTSSSRFNFVGSVDYDVYSSSKHISKVVLGVNGAAFSINGRRDSANTKVFERMMKVVPSVKVYLRDALTSTKERWFDLRTFIIREQFFNYVFGVVENKAFPETGEVSNRYLNQLSFNVRDDRVLYPYSGQLALQQGDGFYRVHFTGNYFFNYAKSGGFNLRWFAAKFGYLGDVTLMKRFETAVYQPKLTAVYGDEDYTYSSYFLGRNELTGFASQQIMERDGGLKLKTNNFTQIPGRSDNWVASINVNTTLPRKLLPIKLPVKVFADVGTYAEAWKKESSVSRFLYVAGLQLSLFNDVLNVYAPLLFSKEFKILDTAEETKGFVKRITFSIDIDKLKPTGIVKHLLF